MERKKIRAKLIAGCHCPACPAVGSAALPNKMAGTPLPDKPDSGARHSLCANYAPNRHCHNQASEIATLAKLPATTSSAATSRQPADSARRSVAMIGRWTWGVANRVRWATLTVPPPNRCKAELGSKFGPPQ